MCKKSLENVSIDNVTPRLCLSPITKYLDRVKATEIHQNISLLINGKLKLDYEYKSLKEYFHRKFRHFHHESHNIFSLNEINNQPVDGLFLSSISVMHLLSHENDVIVTEELFNFLMELFNFYGEYDPMRK